MFDDQSQINSEPPVNLPVEPQDILASVEHDVADLPPVQEIPNALKSGLLRKKEDLSDVPPPPPPEPEVVAPVNPGRSGIIKWLLIGGGAFIILAGAFFFLTRYKPQSKAYDHDASTVPSTADIIGPTTTGETASAAITDVQTEQPPVITTDNLSSSSAETALLPANLNIDTDNDGLTDAQEQQKGTDSSNPDTDGDLLSDGDEINVWHSDPLKKDTDQDGYPDGSEIQNGYSPLDSAVLDNPPVNTVRFVSSTAMGTWNYVPYLINLKK